MDDQSTNPADASGDSGTTEPDFKAKYNGLNAAFQKRQNDWAAKEAAWAEERQTLEAKAARVADYEAAEEAQRTEAEALEQYETLRERFEADPPAPQRPNEMTRLGWTDRYGPPKVEEKRNEAGWPS